MQIGILKIAPSRTGKKQKGKKCPMSGSMTHHFQHVAICPHCKQRFTNIYQYPNHKIPK